MVKDRMAVLTALMDQGVIPVFYHPDVEVCKNVIQACADGEEAVQHLEHPWDLLLTDIVMPGMDGIEVARQAAARDPSLRIMFITGFAAVALSAQDRAPAGAKVLSKPVHLRDLVAEVEKMMAA